MKKALILGMIYILGFISFVVGIGWIKSSLVIPGVTFIVIGVVICWTADFLPYPAKKKFNLKEEQIQEIIAETEKDAMERKLVFLNNERTREIIDTVSDYSFEDSLIALHVIENKYPNLVIGRGIQL